MSWAVEDGSKKRADRFVQGSVAIIAGMIFMAVLNLPWLSLEYSAINGLFHSEDQLAVAVPMVLILFGVITIFGGVIHIAGYNIGIQMVTAISALTFFISVMVIIVTLLDPSNTGSVLNLLVGPWVCAAGAIFGAISSRLERK